MKTKQSNELKQSVHNYLEDGNVKECDRVVCELGVWKNLGYVDLHSARTPMCR